MLDTLYGLSFDLAFWLQGLGDWLNPVMQFFTFLGNEEFYLFAMPVIAWLIDYNLGARLGLMLLLSTNLNEIIKLSFRMPRPYWINHEVANVDSFSGSYGFPSGHSQNSAAIFGLLAASLKKRWLTYVVIFTIFMVGISRIFLGEHFLTDVLVGWLVGSLILWAYLKLEPSVKTWFAKRSGPEKTGSIFLISLGMIILVAIIMSIPPGYQLPEVWMTNAQAAYPEEEFDPFTISNIITGAATFFGLATGIVWTQADGGFAAKRGSWWQRILRFIVGIIGVLVFWMGLDILFPDQGNLLSYILRYVRYALVGLWISGGAVWVFIKLGLGEREG